MRLVALRETDYKNWQNYNVFSYWLVRTFILVNKLHTILSGMAQFLQVPVNSTNLSRCWSLSLRRTSICSYLLCILKNIHKNPKTLSRNLAGKFNKLSCCLYLYSDAWCVSLEGVANVFYSEGTVLIKKAICLSECFNRVYKTESYFFF